MAGEKNRQTFGGISRNRLRLFAGTAVAASVACALVIVSMVTVLLSRATDMRAALDRSFETRTQTLQVFSLLQDAETGQRGYLITGNDAFLEPYRTALGGIEREVSSLKRLFVDEHEQNILLDKIENLKDQKLALLQHSIDLAGTDGLQAARAVVASGRGKALMDEIRQVIQQMVENEQRIVAARTNDDRNISGAIRLAVYLIFAAGTVIIAGAAWLVYVNFTRRLKSEDSLRESVTRQQAIFNSTIEGIIILNESGSVETPNPAAERLFGYDTGQMRGMDFSKFVNLAGQAEVGTAAKLKTLFASGERQEMSAWSGTGTMFPVEVGLRELMIGERRLYVAVVRDITERKRVEQMKTEFVSTVSHELRTPLTSISGSLGLLTGGAAGALPDAAARLLDIAHKNSQRLIRLINDILDIEKIESGKVSFDMKPMALKALVEQAMEANRGFADTYGVFVKLDAETLDPIVQVDADRMTQVVTNLLSNAIKFSPKGGDVTVSLQPHERGVRLSVSDDGPGIPDEFRARIFSKFAQADASDTRAKGGTGLGLSIAQELTVRMGGKISFETTSGEGTTFHVDLPVVVAQPASGKPRILICEADEAAAARLRDMLSEHDIETDVASDADIAHRMVLNRHFDLALIGMASSTQDCLGLVRRVRGDQKIKHMPMLVMAPARANGVTDDDLSALDVLDWLEKPVETEDLVRSVQQALSHAATARPHVLHVDDDPDVLQIVAGALHGQAEVVSVASLEEARAMLARHTFDVAILDLSLGEASGLDLLPDLRNHREESIPVVIFSAHDVNATIAAKVSVMLTKSRASVENLADAVSRLARKHVA